jgi:hypothetical protein
VIDASTFLPVVICPPMQSEKYKSDISSCKSFLGSLSRCANQYSEDNDKQTNYNLYKEVCM